VRLARTQKLKVATASVNALPALQENTLNKPALILRVRVKTALLVNIQAVRGLVVRRGAKYVVLASIHLSAALLLLKLA